MAVGGLDLTGVDVGARPGASPSARYDAFLSYAHEDARVADRLRWGLLRLGRPFWRTSPRLRVFLDKATMSASSALWPSICRALDGSEWFVLLASPASARSRWVGRELKRWLASRSVDRLLVVLVDGTITWDEARGDVDLSRSTAWHPVLAGAFFHEPRITDLRGVGEDDLTMANPAFVDAVADVGATVSRIPKEALHGAEVRERRRSRRALQAAVVVQAVLLVVALVAATVAVRRQHESERSHDLAVARLLAARSDELSLTDPRLASLLATTAWDYAPIPEARAAMLRRATQPLVGVIAPPPGTKYSAATSPDGTRIAMVTTAGFAPGTLTVVDPVTRQPLGSPIRTGLADPRIVAHGPGGLVAMVTPAFTTSGDQMLVVWDTEARRQQASIAIDTSPNVAVSAAVFSSDERTLVFSADAAPEGDGSVVRLVDPVSGDPVGDPISLPDGRHVSDLEISPNGETLAIADDRGGIELRKVRSPGEGGMLVPSRDLGFMENLGQRLAFDPAGSRLVSTGWDGTWLWDLRAPEPEARQVAEAGADDVTFSGGGDQIIGVVGDEVTFWDAVSFDVMGPPLLFDDRSYATTVDVTHDRRHLVSTSGRDGSVRVWDLTRYRRTGSAIVMPGDGDPVEWTFDTISYSPDGTSLATAGPKGVVRVWDLGFPDETGTVLPGQEPVDQAEGVHMAWTPDGETLVASTADGTGIVRWDVTTGEWSPLPAPLTEEKVEDLAISPDGGQLAAIWSDGTLHMWDVGPWTPRPTSLRVGVEELGNIPEQIWFGPDSRTLLALTPRMFPATVAGDAVIGWDLGTGRPGEPLRVGDGHRINQASTSHDGRWLAVVTVSGKVMVWDLAARAKVYEDAPDDIEVPDEIAVRDDGRALAYVAGDVTIRVVATGTGEELARLADGDPVWGTIGGAVDLAFRPRSEMLAVAWRKWTVAMWNVPVPGDLVGELCDTAGPALTEEEWATYVGDGEPRDVCAER